MSDVLDVASPSQEPPKEDTGPVAGEGEEEGQPQTTEGAGAEQSRAGEQQTEQPQEAPQQTPIMKMDSKEIHQGLSPPVIADGPDKENAKENLNGSPLMDDSILMDPREMDPAVVAQNDLIANSKPTTELETALMDALKRKESHIIRLSGEVNKLKAFISKRKQTYKRKRKDEGAPTRALSAYNIFVQERFARLAKENEQALKSADSEAQLKRVPPANLVASTGNEWKELDPEEKLKYENRAKADRKRYDEQMAEYQPPDKQANRKRNKTGYNMFFSAHVLRLKQSESGVPSERGSVARLVGLAWKQLSADEKQFYEREADKHNGMNPVKDDGDDDDDDDAKRVHLEHYQMHQGHEMQMHGGMPHPGMHPPSHDPRHAAHYGHYPPHMYATPAYAHYDYSQHHQRQPQGRGQPQGSYAYPPPPQRHPYESGGMTM